ncbi:MAG: chemotaxis protein CheB [Flavobacteriales bacterium]|nr:chemotaxis protein CheB [Flavobacteriales bacterium]
MNGREKYEAIVLGASAGGMKVTRDLVTALPKDFSMPIIIVQHIGGTSDGVWAELLNDKSAVHVKEADEKEKLTPGAVYLAPANYHLLVEPDHTLTLTVDERVNYARPSIDVLFETAAEAYGDKLIGVVCTGANFDGAKGLAYIKEKGGLTIVQDPETAESPPMPKAAIEATTPDHVLSMENIIEFLLKIHHTQFKRP